MCHQIFFHLAGNAQNWYLLHVELWIFFFHLTETFRLVFGFFIGLYDNVSGYVLIMSMILLMRHIVVS